MGYYKHSTIVATSWDKRIEETYQHIKSIIEDTDESFLTCLTPLQTSVINSNRSFSFLPDGSKEGWETSDIGDDICQKICDYLNKQWSDGAAYIDFVFIRFGGDDDTITVSLAHKNEYKTRLNIKK